MERDPTRGLENNRRALLIFLRSLGAGLLIGTGAIHIDLYVTGYDHIPTIGTLFLVQIIVAFLIAIAIYVLPIRPVALSGALFAAGNLVVYEIFRATTIFGFHEVRTDAGFWAGLLEALAFASLAGYATLLPRSEGESRGALAPVTRLLATRASLATAGVVAIALVVVTALSAIPHTSPTTTSAPHVSGASVAVTIQGFAFHPADLTVTPGETIVVTNKDGVAHTFTSNTGSFDSGLVNPGQTVDVKAPEKSGTYPYKCTIHVFMTGTLTVS
jgi:plastocyanin